MPYVPDPTDVTEPTDAIIAETAAAEFRALKAYIQTVLAGGVPGQAKAGVTFDGTGAPGAIIPLNSFNIASVTKNGTGDYFIDFTSNMSTVYYVVAGSVKTNSGSGQEGPKINNATDPAVNRCRILTTNLGVVADSNRVSIVFFDI